MPAADQPRSKNPQKISAFKDVRGPDVCGQLNGHVEFRAYPVGLSRAYHMTAAAARARNLVSGVAEGRLSRLVPETLGGPPANEPLTDSLALKLIKALVSRGYRVLALSR
jgi:hypothetical protein